MTENRIRPAVLSILLTALLLLAGLLFPAAVPAEEVSTGSFSNSDEIVQVIRKAMLDHSPDITISYRSDQSNDLEALSRVVSDWVEQAFAETGNAREGDYLRFQYAGKEIRYTRETDSDGLSVYTIHIYPKYYTKQWQETRVTRKVREIIHSFSFTDETTDYEKIRTIYDHVCRTVSYDYMNLNNSLYRLKATAYSAVIKHTAVCQGYSTLLYRLLTECGIKNRVITGSAWWEGRSEYHSWNLIQLNGRWYWADPTWDSALSGHRFFLRSENDFPDHAADEKFLQDPFLSDHPMASAGYLLEADPMKHVRTFSLPGGRRYSMQNIQLLRQELELPV